MHPPAAADEIGRYHRFRRCGGTLPVKRQLLQRIRDDSDDRQLSPCRQNTANEKRSFEITWVEVICRSRDRPGVHIGTSTLFTPEWQSKALGAAEGRVRVTRLFIERALDNSVAEWCSRGV